MAEAQEETRSMRLIRISGVDRPIGFIDDLEKRYYIPDNSSTIQRRINEADLSGDARKQAFDEYHQHTRELDAQGYECCLICDRD